MVPAGLVMYAAGSMICREIIAEHDHFANQALSEDRVEPLLGDTADDLFDDSRQFLHLSEGIHLP